MSDPAGAPVVLVVPNLSAGRDPAVIARLARAFASDAHLLDTHSDPAHNRTVFTLASRPGRAATTLAAGAREAIAAIDMTAHAGEHPRIGAIDVAPVVWLDGSARGAAADQAHEAAAAIAALGVPVFLYGELATAPERRERAYFRKGGLAALHERMASGGLRPDYGPPAAPHPTAGATLVSARPPLAAFNLELGDASLATAREIAGLVREAGGGPPGVRAIGLALGESRTQVSTNVHDPIGVPLGAIAERVEGLAGERGARVVAAEIVGLVPRAALVAFPAHIPLPGFDPALGVIEERIAGLT